jgi:hypothetical protein
VLLMVVVPEAMCFGGSTFGFSFASHRRFRSTFAAFAAFADFWRAANHLRIAAFTSVASLATSNVVFFSPGWTSSCTALPGGAGRM